MNHCLFISHARGLHGAEAVMLRAIKACTQKGAKVTVVLPSILPDNGLAKSLAILDNTTAITLPYRAAGKNTIRTALVRLYNLYALFRLACLVRREHIDTIYSNTSITILGADLARLTNTRHIWHFHEPVDTAYGWHQSLKGLYRRLVQRANTLVCISHAQQQEWENALGLTLSNAQVIYNPIKPILANPLPHKGIRIGYIGHFEPRKNLPLLAQVFSRRYRDDTETQLWLCGAKNEAEIQATKNLFANATSEVVILPQTDQVADFYNQIDILVLPSWRETMPLVVFEAMQAGVCVLQTDQSGMKELLQDRRETLFFSPHEPETLASLLQECLDADFRHRIAAAGQAKVQQLIQNNAFDQQIATLLCAS